MSERNDEPLILLTGASGYVGRRLLAALEAAGRRVRCLVRRAGSLPSGPSGKIEVVVGDLLTPASLQGALNGVHTAYYLVHSMASGGSFEEEDRRAARNFAEAARTLGLRRIIYLGGLGSGDKPLSPHLRSRQEVGKILRSSGVPVIEFRASIVIGAGSLSFEMVRTLVERLPVMITPRWVSAPAQPIAIQDLVRYLLDAVDCPSHGSGIFEIGGADRVSYGGLMLEYARQRGLKRLVIRVPVRTPRLSSLWLGLVTPLYVRVGRKLIDSIRHPTVVTNQSALAEFAIRPIGYREAIETALRDEDRELAHPSPSAVSGSRYVDSRIAAVSVPAQRAFEPIRRIGGATGWYYANWLWRLRGALDVWMGGVGLTPGRRDPDQLVVGDVVDCWQVEVFEPDRHLRLAARMKLPGRAWLDFRVDTNTSGSVIRQTAIFDPRGLLGRAYWYLVYPVHQRLFAGMLGAIARRAQAGVVID
jgi:uncharacterized protein YbjT (DUF2867 family)